MPFKTSRRKEKKNCCPIVFGYFQDVFYHCEFPPALHGAHCSDAPESWLVPTAHGMHTWVVPLLSTSFWDQVPGGQACSRVCRVPSMWKDIQQKSGIKIAKSFTVPSANSFCLQPGTRSRLCGFRWHSWHWYICLPCCCKVRSPESSWIHRVAISPRAVDLTWSICKWHFPMSPPWSSGPTKFCPSRSWVDRYCLQKSQWWELRWLSHHSPPSRRRWPNSHCFGDLEQTLACCAAGISPPTEPAPQKWDLVTTKRWPPCTSQVWWCRLPKKLPRLWPPAYCEWWTSAWIRWLPSHCLQWQKEHIDLDQRDNWEASTKSHHHILLNKHPDWQRYNNRLEQICLWSALKEKKEEPTVPAQIHSVVSKNLPPKKKTRENWPKNDQKQRTWLVKNQSKIFNLF